MRVVLHVAPHPDDELMGAPATLMALRDAGWRVVNLACGLGRPQDQERRRRELTLACERAGFELEIPAELPGLGRHDDLNSARVVLTEIVSGAIQRHNAGLVIGPSPQDAHHAHEAVGDAVTAACTAAASQPRMMLWGLWGDLASPNLLTGFEEPRLAEIQFALSAHTGELERNNYSQLVRARAEMNAVLGAERVFGFGSARTRHRYADLLRAYEWGEHGDLLAAAPAELDVCLL